MSSGNNIDRHDPFGSAMSSPFQSVGSMSMADAFGDFAPGSLFNEMNRMLEGFSGISPGSGGIERAGAGAATPGQHGVTYSMSYVGGTTISEDGKPKTIFEERHAYSNPAGKEERRALTRGIDQQARKLVREKVGDEPVKDSEYLRNIERDQVDAFDQSWRSHAQRRSLGALAGNGRDSGRDRLRSSHAQSNALDMVAKDAYSNLSLGFSPFSRHLTDSAYVAPHAPTRGRNARDARVAELDAAGRQRISQLEAENRALREELRSARGSQPSRASSHRSNRITHTPNRAVPH